jgi:hypothetical protein
MTANRSKITASFKQNILYVREIYVLMKKKRAEKKILIEE